VRVLSLESESDSSSEGLVGDQAFAFDSNEKAAKAWTPTSG
jgi:hypothetical protein